MQYENCATALDYFATRSPAACNLSSIFLAGVQRLLPCSLT